MGDADYFGAIDGNPKLKDLKSIYTAFRFHNIFKKDLGDNK
jgi:hypothetical protein